jgi:hypothetical protein
LLKRATTELEINEISRRFKTDEEDFKNFHFFDYSFENSRDSEYQKISDKIKYIINMLNSQI